MRRFERLFLYAGVGLALALALRASPILGPAANGAPTLDERPPRVAVVALYRIADELMDSDRFKPARTEYETELREESLKPLMQELKQLQSAIESMDKKDPGFSEARERYFRLQSGISRVTQEIAQKVERRIADQLVECYQLVRSASVDVAADLGFNYVIASNGPDEDLKKESVSGLVRDLLGRPVLVYPAGADITEDVRQDLKLE